MFQLYSCTQKCGNVDSFFIIIIRSLPRGEQFLVRWAAPQLHDIDALSRMVDPSLKGTYPSKSLSRLADIISLCVQVSFTPSLFILTLFLFRKFNMFHRMIRKQYILFELPHCGNTRWLSKNVLTACIKNQLASSFEIVPIYYKIFVLPFLYKIKIVQKDNNNFSSTHVAPEACCINFIPLGPIFVYLFIILLFCMSK